MKKWLFLALLGTMVGAGRPATEGAPASPVVVELFTSEGCSSCPPADDLLGELAAKQPVPGARIIALGEHVDYWDHLGWRDRFSAATFTARQQNYAEAFKRPDNLYSPQMIVNGKTEFVGSDRQRAMKAIAAAARETMGRVRVTLSPVRPDSQNVSLAVRVEPLSGTPFDADLDVLVGVTEDGLWTDVKSGENGGHRLRHAAVVRSLASIGMIRKGAPSWSQTTPVRILTGWKPQALSFVAFARNRATLAIVGADAR